MGPDPPPDAIAGFDHGHGVPIGPELAGGGEPRHPRTDDENVLALTGAGVSALGHRMERCECSGLEKLSTTRHGIPSWYA